MSITLPNHNFPYWSDPSAAQNPPALIVGAGFSTPQVRLPIQLTKHYAKLQTGIEKRLSIATNFKFQVNGDGEANDADDLYRWAGRCIEELIKLPDATEHEAKRELVSAIGLLEDQGFAATANIPLRGTTPRHRVLARLAREGCIFSLWSLNWDLWLEAAFEAVGLVRRSSNSLNSSDDLPTGWKKSYQVFLPSDNPNQSNDCILLYKPHGCIGSFAAQTDSTFKITKAELEQDVPVAIEQSLRLQLAAKPVCAIGWGATEGNLLRVFQGCADANQLLAGQLTVIGLSWNDGVPTTDTRHSKLAESFAQNATNTLCSVQRNCPGTTDDLMQWIQSLRTLHRFEQVLKGLAPNDVGVLKQIEQQIDVFKLPVYCDSPSGWALSWFDTFVPVWARMCFSSKTLIFTKDGDVPVAALPMIRRDEHIPLNDNTAKRWDLLSAAYLYSILLRIDPAKQRALDFETFPGAFWHIPTRSLLIPIPMWGDVIDISLAALKPLIESRHWSAMGRVRDICLLRMNHDLKAVAQPNEQDIVLVWKQGVSTLMKSSAFANAANIEDLDALHLDAYLQKKESEL